MFTFLSGFIFFIYFLKIRLYILPLYPLSIIRSMCLFQILMFVNVMNKSAQISLYIFLNYNLVVFDIWGKFNLFYCSCFNIFMWLLANPKFYSQSTLGIVQERWECSFLGCLWDHNVPRIEDSHIFSSGWRDSTVGKTFALHMINPCFHSTSLLVFLMCHAWAHWLEQMCGQSSWGAIVPLFQLKGHCSSPNGQLVLWYTGLIQCLLSTGAKETILQTCFAFLKYY